MPTSCPDGFEVLIVGRKYAVVFEGLTGKEKAARGCGTPPLAELDGLAGFYGIHHIEHIAERPLEMSHELATVSQVLAALGHNDGIGAVALHRLNGAYGAHQADMDFDRPQSLNCRGIALGNDRLYPLDFWKTVLLDIVKEQIRQALDGFLQHRLGPRGHHADH